MLGLYTRQPILQFHLLAWCFKWGTGWGGGRREIPTTAGEKLLWWLHCWEVPVQRRFDTSFDWLIYLFDQCFTAYSRVLEITFTMTNSIIFQLNPGRSAGWCITSQGEKASTSWTWPHSYRRGKRLLDHSPALDHCYQLSSEGLQKFLYSQNKRLLEYSRQQCIIWYLYRKLSLDLLLIRCGFLGPFN